jgi:paraquat-inducible protein A
MQSDNSLLACPLCGQLHCRQPLRPGQKACCVRCETILEERARLGPDAALAFTLAGLVLAIPSALLPFVTLVKVSATRTSFLTGSFVGLWSHDMDALGFWVLCCGVLAPFALLLVLAAAIWTERHAANGQFRQLRQLAQFIEYWAMPEVQILGVMVAFFKLGDVVDVSIGPGLWCYAAASLFTLLAWRHFNLQPRTEGVVADGPA